MRPKEIILEVTNFCNLSCKYCHIHGEKANFFRQKGIMEKNIWKKVLNEIHGWAVPVNLITHGAGEPLLYPYIKELLIEAKKSKQLIVGFMTNAMLLKKEIVDFLIDIQLDWLAFSIDGISSETNDTIREGAKYSEIEKNIFYLIEQKEKSNSSKPFLKFNMVQYPNIQNQKEEYLAKWLPYAQAITFSKFRPINSKFLWHDKEKDIDISFTPCRHLFEQAVVSWSGDLALCCEDINLEVSPGSVKMDSIESIFTYSQTYKKYRSFHEQGKIDRLTLCSKCHVWASSIELENRLETISGHELQLIKTPSAETYLKLYD